MIRGTSTQWKLVLPYTKDQIESMTIMFWQPNNPSKYLPIKKHKENCRWKDDTSTECYVSLRPFETALFLDKYKAKMQFSVKPISECGLPFGSQEILIKVYPMPDDLVPEEPEDDPTAPSDDEWTYLDGGNIIN